MVRAILLVTYLAWAAFAFWVFSWSSSASFFEHDPWGRLPPFFAAYLAALVLPLSVWWQRRAVVVHARRPLVAWLLHAVVAAVSLVPLAVVAGLMARAPEPFRVSADDSMGLGIDWLVLLGMAIASSVVLAIALVIRRPARPPDVLR